MKKMAIILLALSLLMSGGNAFAAQPVAASEHRIELMRYQNFESIIPTVTLSGAVATYSLTVEGMSNVTSISATLQIQRQNASGHWSDYGSSWPATSSSNFLFTSGTKVVVTGGTYRLKVTVTPFIGKTAGTPETAYS